MSIIGQTFNVLDKGSVTLIDLLPHPATGVTPDMAIVNAARVSFLGESKGEDRDKKLLFYLMAHDHGSPFEQVVFKLRIKCPLMTFAHFVRYREQSINAQSGRYTETKDDEFYIPDVWRRQAVNNKQASDGVVHDDDSDYLTRALIDHAQAGYKLYETALRLGVAREQARLFLPGFALYTTWVTTLNARSLMNMFRQRMTTDAQFETRRYVETIYHKIFTPLMPWTAEAFETQGDE